MERKLTNGTLVLYASIKQLPIKRYNQMNSFLAQELGMGSDLEAISKHYAKFDGFIAAGDLEALKQERINLHYCLYMLLEDVDLKSRAFLCFVHKINGTVIGDLDDDAEVEKARKLMEDIGATIGDVEDIFAEVKKKLIWS